MIRQIGPLVLAASALTAGCGEQAVVEEPAVDLAAAESVAAANDSAPTYVGSDNCGSCHADQHEKWRGSHHQLAMQPATASTVVGDFSGASFDYAGTRYAFLERDGSYVAQADDENGELTEFEITHTFGIDPLQQYLVSFPDGRLQALSVAWDTRPEADGGQRWFHIYADESVTHEDELHWTGRSQNWNFMCADCHSTDLRKNYDAKAKTFDTRWAEITVGCESCHGPASVHLENARTGKLPADIGFSLDMTSQPTQVDTCARCHSRRGILAEGFAPGGKFLDHYRPALLDEGLYHADGQILDEVYVYGSFLQSKMHQRGVVCTDCHDAHSAKLSVGGNGTCTACHQSSPPERFPTLKAAVYDHPDHHFHAPGTDGAQCVSCHMASKTYMVVDPRRDHSFRVPRPDLAASTGAPDACTGCHNDQDADWAAAEIARRFGAERPAHYGEAIAAGRRSEAGAIAKLAAVAGDTTRPAIVRGTALSLLSGRSDRDAAAALESGLRDAQALVRLGALAGVDGLGIQQRWDLASHLLDDKLLAIRSDAAVALAPMLRRGLPFADAERLRVALDDYIATQELNADRPEALVNLASVYSDMSRPVEAERAFEQALVLEPDGLPALVNLADFYSGQDREDEAGELLSRARSLAPGNGAVRHAYGLHLVRRGALAGALPELAEAVRLAPANARYRYVYGVALNSSGRGDEAVLVLESALEAFPDDADILFALATMQRDRGNVFAALVHVDRLLELSPGNAQLLRLRNQLLQSN